jgi:hypothetical protein
MSAMSASEIRERASGAVWEEDLLQLAEVALGARSKEVHGARQMADAIKISVDLAASVKRLTQLFQNASAIFGQGSQVVHAAVKRSARFRMHARVVHTCWQTPQTRQAQRGERMLCLI